MNLRTIYFESIELTDTGNHNLTLPVDASLIQQIIITVENETAARPASLRFRCDGTAVTTTVGVPMANLETREISDINDIINFSFMNLEATTTMLHVEYFGIDN